jgi:hypothetical protein
MGVGLGAYETYKLEQLYTRIEIRIRRVRSILTRPCNGHQLLIFDRPVRHAELLEFRVIPGDERSRRIVFHDHTFFQHKNPVVVDDCAFRLKVSALRATNGTRRITHLSSTCTTIKHTIQISRCNSSISTVSLLTDERW